MKPLENEMMKKKAPVFFIGHGSPMNAIAENEYTRSLGKLRNLFPHPKAILVISAHWMTPETCVTHMKNPKTIHDFYGFPKALFDVQYPAPGDPQIADEIIQRLANASPKIKVVPDDTSWGFDHGTWSVLCHIFPEAQIPVLQLSLHATASPEYHFEVGRSLRFLREMGVLIIGSGNIVHNLQKIKWDPESQPYDWAIAFDQKIKSSLESQNLVALLSDFRTTSDGRLSAPTPEHYLPLLYVIGAADSFQLDRKDSGGQNSAGQDQLYFDYEGIDLASISMRTLSYRS